MYYGQGVGDNPRLDEVIHKTFFENVKNGFFVECGAYDGLVDSTCKFFEESMDWKGLNIEPVPYTFERLVKNRPNSINERCALSSKNGTATFANPIHPVLGKNFGCGSLQHQPIQLKELNGCTFDVFDVETICFNDLYKRHSLPNIDLFVLDVEGHEEDALPGILSIPSEALPKVFCIEDSITGDSKITQLLSEHYTYHSRYYQNAFFIKK